MGSVTSGYQNRKEGNEREEGKKGQFVRAELTESCLTQSPLPLFCKMWHAACRSENVAKISPVESKQSVEGCIQTSG